MATRPGPDELRIRDLLRRRGVGPDAEPPAVPPALPEGFEAAPAPRTAEDEWWDQLYGDEDRATGRPPAAPAARSGRLADWWGTAGPGKSAPDTEDPGTGLPDTDPDDLDPGYPDTEDPDTGSPDTNGPDNTGQSGRSPARWDPVTIADRIVQAQQQRPVADRLREAATAAQAKPRLGQLAYTASGAWAAWQAGFTPWLLAFTADAPMGVPIALAIAGWCLHRRADGVVLPVAWCVHAAYTATVLNLVLQP